MQHILLIDDHPIITDSLKLVIETSIANCKTDVANNTDTAFEKIKHTNYDLIVMDVSLPDANSSTIVGNIRTIRPASKILMFSTNSEGILAKRYLKMGAMGFLSKEAPLDEIKSAIETALENKRYISPGLKEKLIMDALDKNNQENQFDKLSPREFEIVQHLVHGESVSEISKKLKLHTSTIGTHKARIFEKLHCDNIVELVKLAKIHNIVL